MSNQKHILNNISPIEVFDIISSQTVPDDVKLAHIQNLKTHIKKDTIDLRNVDIYLQIICKGLEITNSNISSVSFNSLFYLIKRINVQDSSGAILERQSFLILPILINKLGSSSSGSGSGVTSAKKSLEDYWLSNPDAVEEAISEISFTGSNIRITIESINWITQVFKNISSKLNVSKFVPKILKSLKQNSHNQELVSSIQDLFSVYLIKNPSVTDELQRLIQSHSFPSIVVERLLKKSSSKEPESRSSETDVTMDTEVTSYPHGTLETTLTAASTGHEAELHELLGKVNYRLDSSVKPIDIQDSHSLYSTFEVFAPSFEGKESESNWKIREKNVVQMRSILRGNSPSDFHSELIQCLQNLSVGICKATSSLRTTLSSNGCQFLKECAVILRYSFETISENIFPTLIKLCASTKNIASSNANMAVCALYANLPYSQRMVQRIVTASEERNHQPRSYSLIWLHIVLLRIGIDHSYIGSHELFVLEAANKVFMKLLKDANPNVRQVAKECYWCFTRIYPNDAEKLLKKLEPNIVRALERSQRESGGSGIGPIKSFTSRPSRPSIKEAIMEKNKELRQKRPPSRNSTESIASRNPLPLPKPPRSKTPTSRLEKSLVRPADKPQQQQSQHHQQPSALRAASWTQPTQSSLIAAATVRPKQRERSKTEVLKKSPIVVADTKATKTNGHHSSRPASDIDMPIFDRANDPMLNFLSSENSSLIAEGINLLKYAIISGEDIPDEVNGMLKKISERHVLLMKPLFNANDKVFKKAGKLLNADDFLRVCMLIFPDLDDNTFDLIIATIELDVFYRASCSLLTCISDLPNIPGSHALVMQILNHKLEITKVVLQGLSISLSKLPIADIQFENIFQELTRLIISLKGTDNFQLLSQLFRQLYTIDSNKFVLLLEDVEIKSREEIAIIVGIEKSRVKVPSVAFSKNIDEMTEVRRPNGGFISPAKRPTTANDFTMVLAKRSELLHGANEPVRPKLSDINDALSRPNSKTIKGVSPLRPATDQSDMLVDEFSNVSITEDASKISPMKNRDNRTSVNGAGVNNDNLKHIMDKIDPFKSMSNKMRKISIFEDNKRQERNWSNLQYARLPRGNQPTTTTTTTPAGATGATSHHHRQHLLNQFSLNKEDFERNCKNLSDVPNQSNVLKVTAILDNLNASDYEFREYFMNKGKVKLESSLWNFFDKIDTTHQQSLLLNGLYLLKQLIKFNDSLSCSKLFQLLKRTCKDEELDSEMFFIWNELLFSISHISISSDLEETILKYLESNEKNLTVSSLSLNYLAKILLEDKFLDLVKLYRLDKILGGLFNEDEVMFRKSAVVCFSNLFKNEWMSSETRDTLNKLKSKYPVSQQRLIEFYVKR